MTDSYDYDDLLLSLQTFMRNTDAFRDVNWDGSAAKALLRVGLRDCKMLAEPSRLACHGVGR